MGEVIEVGPGNSTLQIGDRVIIPFTIAWWRMFLLQKRTDELL